MADGSLAGLGSVKGRVSEAEWNARVDLAAQQREADATEPDGDEADADAEGESVTDGPSATAQAGLATYQQVGSPPSTAAQLNLIA